ncbi:MAG: hypothetical protein HZA47_07295 [Planctomycetes bacterium]|nr:hypothetical protein [Planctomycetota bacterium]MBI5796101.1 hypothetical protein [Planctomycetota bacterium]
MTKYYAHSLENMPEEKWQTLDIHLTEVADLAEKFAKAINPAIICRPSHGGVD